MITLVTIGPLAGHQLHSYITHSYTHSICIYIYIYIHTHSYIDIYVHAYLTISSFFAGPLVGHPGARLAQNILSVLS